MTRAEIGVAITQASLCERPIEFALQVLKPYGAWATQASDLADHLRRSEGWKLHSEPVWSAFWWDDSGKCGFVFRKIVNGPGGEFLSADNTGKMNRVPAEGKYFVALKAG